MNHHLFDTDNISRGKILALLKKAPDGLTLSEIADRAGISIAKTLPHLSDLAKNQQCDRVGQKYRLTPTSYTEEKLGRRLEIAAESPIPRVKLQLPQKAIEKEKENRKRGRPRK